VAPQDSENCGRNFAKRKQSDAEFVGNRLLYAWLLLTYIVINTILGRQTLDPAGMHCPSWDDAFVSSLYCVVTRKLKSYLKYFNLRVTIYYLHSIFIK